MNDQEALVSCETGKPLCFCSQECMLGHMVTVRHGGKVRSSNRIEDESDERSDYPEA